MNSEFILDIAKCFTTFGAMSLLVSIVGIINIIFKNGHEVKSLEKPRSKKLKSKDYADLDKKLKELELTINNTRKQKSKESSLQVKQEIDNTTIIIDNLIRRYESLETQQTIKDNKNSKTE